MSDRARVTIGRSMAAVAAASAVAGTVWLVLMGQGDVLWAYVIHNVAVALGLAAMAWLVLPTQPGNLAVWTAVAAAFTTGLVPTAAAVGQVALDSIGITAPWDELSPARLPTWAALIMQPFMWLWMGILLLPTLLLLLFPDGRLPSRRWRPVAWVTVSLWVTAVIGLIGSTLPSSTLTYGEATTAASLDGLFPAMTTVGYLGLVAAIPVSVAALVVRFRRSQGLERQQFRWVMWGASIGGPILIVAAIFEIAGRLDVTLPTLLLSLLVLIGSIGVAIGRYRLYAVDVVISRTVVFAVLAGFIALVYAAAAVGLGQLLGQGGEWAPIIATAAVAFAFEPVRQVGQRWANRIAYGHRASPYEVLADLTGRLSGAEAADGLLARTAELLAEGTGAEQATVWLGPPDAMTPAATTSSTGDERRSPDLDEETVFPVTHDGSVVGALEVIKRRGTKLSSPEKALMRDLAGSASAVLAYQRLNDSLAVKAAEIEASRRRLVAAEDRERKRLERELDEGAQQLILALKVNVDLARRRAEESGADGLAGLLAGLAEETQAALDEVRNLAKGIYPPVLESDGIGAAVSSLAASTPVEVSVSKDGIGRYAADVEAAVYFNISEAVTNAVKHASPPIRIEISDSEGALRFAVVDSGPGFDPETTDAGSGLGNLQDRIDAVGGYLSITSAPGSGTTVAGEIPLVAADSAGSGAPDIP